MTIITDKVRIKNGADYSFVFSKVKFAITCSSSLHHGSYNLIDLDLVTKMKILQNDIYGDKFAVSWSN